MTINQKPIKSITTPTRIKSLAVLAIGAVFMAACSGGVPITAQEDSAPASAETAEATQDAAAAPAAPTGVAATLGDTLLGEVLVGPNGMTLYGFTNDAQAASTCYGTCADAWPPVIVERDFALAPALDEGAFATTERDDGSFQLVAGKWPLYYFAGDAVPGDAKGQGSGDVWFVVDGVGTLIRDAEENSAGSATDETQAADADANESTSPVSVIEGPLGEMLVDSQGLSLYGFTNDTDGTPTCEGACADAWPAMIVDDGQLPAGLDPEVFSLVERPDGQQQLKAGKWPLYYFAGDATAGDINGQGSGDVWFLAASDGSLLKGEESAAGPSPTPATGSDDSSDSDSGYGYSS